MPEADPRPPLDTPGTLNRQIIEASERARRLVEEAADGGKTSRSLAAQAELTKLLEMRLRIAGVLTPPGQPKSGPGRPTGTEDHGGDGSPGLYEVAAALRAALLELPEVQRAGATAALADAFPALLAAPLEPEPLKLTVPQHLKPSPGGPPSWTRHQWGG